jgi:hypothetical protein
MGDSNDKIDDADSLAATLKPLPRISQRPTLHAPPINSISPIRRPNWDILTSLSFVVLLIIAIILYIFVNHPFRHSQKTVIIHDVSPVLITAPIESMKIPEHKPEIINPPSSSSANNQIVLPHKKVKLIKDDGEKDYGI